MDNEFFFVTEYERKALRNSRIIVVSSEIDSGTAHEFIEDVHVILNDSSREPVTIIIASPGGDVFSGIAMIRAIRKAQAQGIKFIGEVHGHACSMAFFILQCCDERAMGTLDVLMAHGITTGFSGDMKNMEAETKLLNYWHHELANLVASRCSGDEFQEPGFWYEILRDNTPQWYTAEESKEMGLIDRIDDTDNKS
jgi:ATP-dependent Clp protease protease subunit